MRRAILLILAIVALLLLVGGIPALTAFLADWYWFQALQLEPIFVKQLLTKLALGGGVTVLAFAFLFANMRIALRGVVPDPLIVPLRGSQPSININRILRLLTYPVAAVFALMIGTASSGAWLTVLRYLERSTFGTVDPVFGRDIGHYVFAVPAFATGISLLTTLAIVALVLTVPVYLLRRDVILLRRRVTVEPSAQWHLAALVAFLLLTLALRVFVVEVPSIMYATTGPFLGASYSDLAVKLPALRATGIAALVGMGLVLWGGAQRRLVRHAVIAVVLYMGAALLGAMATSAVQRFVVVPNELNRERAQLERHITATREAWGLADVQVRDLSGESRLTLQDIQANAPTIRNVRLWDREPLLQTFGQLQEIRTYYDFVSVDDDRYWIDGEYRQVLLSPRELNSASLPTRSFINEHLTFTHGMGLTLGPVNQVTQEGLPVLFIRDLPPVSDVSLEVSRPGIYYGELSNEWVFVKTRQEEFDYPSGEGNVFTTYGGAGGVPVSSLLRRIVYATRFGSMKILLSEDITGDSRVMYHRRIQERVRKALPFLYWDGDPYMVIGENGRLVWILDAYTATDRYPYAARLSNGMNYMRNSVKVVLDAYDGTIEAYVADPDDPLIDTYASIFPGVFRTLDDLSADLRSHLRYPEDLFRVQTMLYATYHMGEPEIFYHREDEWQIPVVTGGESGRDPFLRHIIMKLPGESREEFILMTPFTPRGKDNLSAWMVARNDGDRLGDLVVYRFPRQRLVFGPTQVVNRINQDTEISRQISLWDQRGSQVIRGNLLVIPIEESLIFVQALYLRAEGGRIPELKRVIVAYENQVVMEETLEEALAALFGGATGTDRPTVEREAAALAAAGEATPAVGVSFSDLIDRASRAYERAIEAQRSGDWARYGEEMRQVGELLRQLRDAGGGDR
jgi:uncharacterized membrane protein (UPF0182 family)